MFRNLLLLGSLVSLTTYGIRMVSVGSMFSLKSGNVAVLSSNLQYDAVLNTVPILTNLFFFFVYVSLCSYFYVDDE